MNSCWPLSFYIYYGSVLHLSSMTRNVLRNGGTRTLQSLGPICRHLGLGGRMNCALNVPRHLVNCHLILTEVAQSWSPLLICVNVLHSFRIICDGGFTIIFIHMDEPPVVSVVGTNKPRCIIKQVTCEPTACHSTTCSGVNMNMLNITAHRGCYLHGCAGWRERGTGTTSVFAGNHNPTGDKEGWGTVERNHDKPLILLFINHQSKM